MSEWFKASARKTSEDAPYGAPPLLQQIEAAHLPGDHRPRHLPDGDADRSCGIPAQHHDGGGSGAGLLVRKLAAPDWQLNRLAGDPSNSAVLPAAAPDADEDALARLPGLPHTCVLPSSPWPLKLYSFGNPEPSCRRILALQLGHLGDFVISLPALRQMRALFRDSHITLLVGTWNHLQAEACGLVDNIESFDFFPEIARNWDGRSVADPEMFRRAAAGFFDLAIDLRVDLDTRYLLQLVDARVRAGIAPGGRFPYLDVALPYDYARRVSDYRTRDLNAALGPDRFQSRMPHQDDFRHETDFTVTNTHVIFGPYLCLPAGQYCAHFDLSFRGFGFGRPPARVTLDVVQGASDVLVARVLDGGTIRRGGSDELGLTFTIRDEFTPCEFRVHVAGRPLRAVLGFGGVKVKRVDEPPSARVKPADLHVGELMSLLVQLTSDRLAPATAYPVESSPTGQRDELLHAGHSGPVIVIAPASNSDLRDWPADHYATLAGLLVERLNCSVVLLGLRDQADITAHVARESKVEHRITDLAGRTAWADIPGILQSADLVICNNSGIGHLAASLGARTLAIYSASHQPQEWGPRGPMAHAVMAVVPCSPCGLDRLSECGNGHMCMQDLAPLAVFGLAERLLRPQVSAVGAH